MVNLDLLSKNAASLLPVSGVVDTVVVRLGRLFANKLLEGGHTTAAQLLALKQSETPSHEEADQYLTHLDCPLFAQIRTVVALSSLQFRTEVLEDKLLSLLALRARRELNLISEDPPLATRLAQEIEALLTASPIRRPQPNNLVALQNNRITSLTNRCLELFARPTLSWMELVRSENALPVKDNLLWASHLAQAVAHAGGLIHRLDSQFGKDPVEENDPKHPSSYRQILKHKHRHLNQQRQTYAATTRQQSRRWEDESAQLMTERNFHAFAICIDNVVMHLNQKLDVWHKNEIARSSRQKTRLLDVENFHYADGIRRSLHQQGESLEDTLTCAEKLLHYCHANQVSASELMDDEIWTLFPRVNRENLKQARLKVRHSDESFPLSVAHREWITQVTESALTQRS